MTKEEWDKFHGIEVNRYWNSIVGLGTGPDSWSFYSKAMLEYIDRVDELTKVYESDSETKNG